MSIRIIVAAALAGGAALLSLHDPAAAQSACNGTVQHFGRMSTQCYYLPTVSDGRVTGLAKHVNVRMLPPNCRYVPISSGSGRSLGTRMICT